MDGALSDAATVPDTSQNLEQLIEGLRGQGYSLVSALGIEDAAATLDNRRRCSGNFVLLSIFLQNIRCSDSDGKSWHVPCS
jgi:hypothetical protein